MFTLLYQLSTMKAMVPSMFLLGTSPSYLIVWCWFRLVTALLPFWVFRVGNDSAYSLYQRLILFFYENYTAHEIIFYGDKAGFFNKKENIVLICNHQSTVDWVIADMLAVRQGSLGSIRYILKDGLRYFPLYGFYFRQHSCIYVKRSGKFQQHYAEAQLKEFIRYDIPFWMVIFPEGTRLNEKTLERSKRFSAKNGLAELNYVLAPRHKAVQLSIDCLRDITDAVYDVTVAYSGTQDPETHARTNAPSLTEYLHTSGNKLHLHLSRVPIGDIPAGEEKIRAWLYDRFQRKEKMLERFYSRDPKVAGTLGDDGTSDRLSLRHTLPALITFTALNIAVLSTKEGRGYYWKAAVVGTAVGWVWMTVCH